MPLTVKFKSHKDVAAGTTAFHFEKPEGFTFVPGQAGEFGLTNPPETDDEGDKRSFSLASAPYEKDLVFATRMRDTAFKRSLKLIPAGTEFTLDAPWGELTLGGDNSTTAVMVTGGIGITPFRSIILQATHDKLPRKLMLFYSNRRPEDAAFLDELMKADKENPNFTLIATMTKMESSSQHWRRETGPITEDLLRKHISDLAAPVYYVSGPPGLVDAMQKTLKEAGVKAARIHAEEFPGY